MKKDVGLTDIFYKLFGFQFVLGWVAYRPLGGMWLFTAWRRHFQGPYQLIVSQVMSMRAVTEEGLCLDFMQSRLKAMDTIGYY